MQNNQNENINYPMLSEEVHNPVYVVKAKTTDLLMARVAHSGTTIQLKGDAHIVRAQAITHLQAGEKLKLMQCDPFPDDTHATFQTLPDDGLFPLNGVVNLGDVIKLQIESEIV